MSQLLEQADSEKQDTLRRLWQVLKPYSSQLCLAMVGMVAVGGFNGLQAYMVKPLLDDIFLKKDAYLLCSNKKHYQITLG